MNNFPFNNIYNAAATAIIEDGKSISYSQLKNKINFLSNYFLNSGIREHDFAAILSANNSDFIISVLALWQIKAIPIPLNIRLTKNELQEQLTFSACKFLIHLDEESESYLYKFNLDLRQIFLPKIQEINDDEVKPILSGDETALILFTSGSSGKPKAVQLTFNNLYHSAINGNQILNQNENDRWLASLPFYHIGGFSIFIRAFLFFSCVVIPKSLQIDNIIFALQNFKPTLASFVSTQLKILVDLKIKPNKELKNILLGGGFINNELITEGIKLNWKITKVYGSTETSSFVTARSCNSKSKKNNSVGKPLVNNEIKIIDENKKIVPPNCSGEILVKSGSVMKGYLNNGEETENKISEGFYYTGDIGYLDDEGNLYIEVRRNDLIITGGENVNPIEVEYELLKFPQIDEACVFQMEDKHWGHIVAAALVLNSIEAIHEDEVKELLNAKIASYKIPKKIFIIDKLPKTSLGKVKKEDLKKLLNF